MPRRSIFTFALMVAVQAAASAQSNPGAAIPSDEIVVTGTRENIEAVRERAASYVHSLGVARGERAVARWIDPICPKALGLSKSHARFVETHILGVAESLQIATAKRPCSSNITISFVSNAGAIVQRISKLEPGQFREVPIELRPILLEGDAPIRWWYSTELRGRDGDRLMGFSPPAVQLDGGGGSLPSGPDTQVLSQYSSSIVSTQTVRALRSATVMVDVDRAEGATLEAVATYAAVVGLAEIRFGGGPKSGSILSLFKETAPVGELTERDKTFLRELYRLPLDRLARFQRGRLIGALASDAKAP